MLLNRSDSTSAKKTSPCLRFDIPDAAEPAGRFLPKASSIALRTVFTIRVRQYIFSAGTTAARLARGTSCLDTALHMRRGDRRIA